MVRFEVAAALVVGVLLPVLETVRRGLAHWRVDFTTMFTDYVAGALLLFAAGAAIRLRSWSRTFLVLAWAYVASMMSGSFWSQLEQTLRGTNLEPNHSIVLAVKFLLWATCLLALVGSLRNASRRQHD